MTQLEPDRDMLEIFADALLRHRGTEGFMSLRSFVEGDDKAPAFRITPVSLKGNFRFLIDCAVDDARRAAQAPRPIVFAPPLCVFGNKDQAREEDVRAGLVLSVECDRNPHEARRQLEELLGPPTIVIRSGGQWIDDDGKAHAKLHLHWCLAQPARSAEDLTTLKNARISAARLVGADGTNNPVCHPIRWPGSWHRKKEPRLCSILAVDPDVEIKLADAVNVLPPPAETQQGHTVENWLTFLDGKYEGSHRGSAIARLAGYLLRHFVDPAITVDLLRFFNAMRCDPPLADEEIIRIVVSVGSREAARREQRERSP